MLITRKKYLKIFGTGSWDRVTRKPKNGVTIYGTIFMYIMIQD